MNKTYPIISIAIAAPLKFEMWTRLFLIFKWGKAPGTPIIKWGVGARPK